MFQLGWNLHLVLGLLGGSISLSQLSRTTQPLSIEVGRWIKSGYHRGLLRWWRICIGLRIKATLQHFRLHGQGSSADYSINPSNWWLAKLTLASNILPSARKATYGIIYIYMMCMLVQCFPRTFLHKDCLQTSGELYWWEGIYVDIIQ